MYRIRSNKGPGHLARAFSVSAYFISPPPPKKTLPMSHVQTRLANEYG